MSPYAAFLHGSEPPKPGTGVALAETLDEDNEVDDRTVLGLVAEPTAVEREAEFIPGDADGVIVQWDHGPRGFEYCEDLAVPMDEAAV